MDGDRLQDFIDFCQESTITQSFYKIKNKAHAVKIEARVKKDPNLIKQSNTINSRVSAILKEFEMGLSKNGIKFSKDNHFSTKYMESPVLQIKNYSNESNNVIRSISKAVRSKYTTEEMRHISINYDNVNKDNGKFICAICIENTFLN